jgi:hypothetical protein
MGACRESDRASPGGYGPDLAFRYWARTRRGALLRWLTPHGTVWAEYLAGRRGCLAGHALAASGC